MSVVTIIGVDPGLVHTGVVVFKFDTIKLTHRVHAEVVDGLDVSRVYALIQQYGGQQPYVFVEKYVDRGTSFSQHGKMREFETLLRQQLKQHWAKFVDNMGVKKIVTTDLLKLLGAWKFQTTNHQDLQAAARIGLYGALKNEELNKVIYNQVTHIIDNK